MRDAVVRVNLKTERNVVKTLYSECRRTMTPAESIKTDNNAPLNAIFQTTKPVACVEGLNSDHQDDEETKLAKGQQRQSGGLAGPAPCNEMRQARCDTDRTIGSIMVENRSK